MDCDQFDTDLFINEIEKRPPICDITCPYYKDRNMKKKCSEEVTSIFYPDVVIKEKQNVGMYEESFFSFYLCQYLQYHVTVNRWCLNIAKHFEILLFCVLLNT